MQQSEYRCASMHQPLMRLRCLLELGRCSCNCCGAPYSSIWELATQRHEKLSVRWQNSPSRMKLAGHTESITVSAITSLFSSAASSLSIAPSWKPWNFATFQTAPSRYPCPIRFHFKKQSTISSPSIAPLISWTPSVSSTILYQLESDPI